jgi:integrase
MEADAFSRQTINNTRKYLTALSRQTDINDPEKVKAVIYQKQSSDAHKKIMAYAYKRYADYYKLAYTMPKYHPKSRQIKIPTKEKVETLINSARAPLCLKLRISAETGLRPIQVHSLRVKDANLETRQLYPEPAKNGNAIVSKISTNTADQLAEYINQNQLKNDEKLFKESEEEYCKHYREYRNRLANKLKDQTLKTIRLYDLRHYFATMLFAKCNNILVVKQALGHKCLDTTMIYTQLLENIDPDYECQTTDNTDQAKKLVESGFEYVATTPESTIYSENENNPLFSIIKRTHAHVASLRSHSPMRWEIRKTYS